MIAILRNSLIQGLMRFAIVFAAFASPVISVSAAQADAGLFTKPMDVLTQYRDRPLFSPSRRALNIPAPVENIAAPIAAPSLNAVLLGVVSASDGTGLAVLRFEGQGDAQRVRVGESLNGWTLDHVESHAAIFKSGEDSITLTFPQTGDANATPEAGVSDAPIQPVMPSTPDPTAP